MQTWRVGTFSMKNQRASARRVSLLELVLGRLELQSWSINRASLQVPGESRCSSTAIAMYCLIVSRLTWAEEVPFPSVALCCVIPSPKFISARSEKTSLVTLQASRIEVLQPDPSRKRLRPGTLSKRKAAQAQHRVAASHTIVIANEPDHYTQSRKD